MTPDTKAAMYDGRPKMKRDAQMKVVFFSREKDYFHSGVSPHFRAFVIRSAFSQTPFMDVP